VFLGMDLNVLRAAAAAQANRPAFVPPPHFLAMAAKDSALFGGLSFDALQPGRGRLFLLLRTAVVGPPRRAPDRLTDKLNRSRHLNNNQGDQRPMLWFFKIFSPKNSAKKLAFLTRNKAKLCKTLIITLVFEKNANFLAENRRKLWS
jgi:hypothetical protein